MIISLYIPCLVDQFLPEVGTATVRLLRGLGMTVGYDPRQTCCGQPAFNAGHRHHAAHLAARTLRLFAESRADAIVAPSGSCVGMLRRHAAELDLDAAARRALDAVLPRLYELTEFLTGPAGLTAVPGRYPRRVAYHPSCHLARELGVRTAPTTLLAGLRDITLLPLADADVCCGFGGTFSIKQPEMSLAMGRDKMAALLTSGADELVLGDAGCLLQVRGTLQGAGVPLPVRHIAEVLADAMEAR